MVDRELASPRPIAGGLWAAALRSSLLIGALGFAGCASTETPPLKADGAESARADAARRDAVALDAAGREIEAERSADRADAKGRTDGKTDQRTDAQRTEADLEREHRARHFYLRGVRLLSQTPARVDEAMGEFTLSIQAYPLYYRSHFKLGYCYYHKGQYALEIAEYKKCLAIEPSYVPARLNLGHAYLVQDKLELAREAYAKVLDQESGNLVARYNLGLVEFDLKNFRKSQEHLEAFLRVQQDPSPQVEQARKCLDRIREKEAQPRQ